MTTPDMKTPTPELLEACIEATRLEWEKRLPGGRWSRPMAERDILAAYPLIVRRARTDAILEVTTGLLMMAKMVPAAEAHALTSAAAGYEEALEIELAAGRAPALPNNDS